MADGAAGRVLHVCAGIASLESRGLAAVALLVVGVMGVGQGDVSSSESDTLVLSKNSPSSAVGVS